MAERPNINTADWYVRKGGRAKKIGPFSLATLARMWDRGNIVSRDLLFAEGILPQWVRAGRLQYLLVDDESEDHEEGDKPVSPSPPAMPSSSAEPSISLSSPTEPAGEVYYILDGEQLRGPITRTQMKMLFSWGEIGPQTAVCDTTGKPIATVAKILQSPSQKRRVSGPPLPVTPKQTPSVPNDHVSNSPPGDSAPNPRGTSKPKPVAKPKRKAEPAQQKQSPKKQKPSKDKEPLSRKGFLDVLSAALDQENNADTTDAAGSHQEPLRAPVRKQRQKKKKTSHSETPTTAPESSETGANRKPFRKLQRSNAYARVCTLWSVIYLIHSLIVLTVVNALFGMFLKRMGSLCLSTYIPFGATPEELKQEALLIAGFATVLTGALMLYHVWYLLRSDCLPWHAIAALGLGLPLGFLIRDDLFVSVFRVVQFSIAAVGVAVILTGFGLLKSIQGPQLSRAFIFAVFLTLLGVCAAIGSLSQPLFEIGIRELPPTLTGTMPTSIVFIACLVLVTLPFPGFCYVVMSKEATRPVKEFWDGHIIAAIICSVLMVAMSYYMVHPEPESFMSIPFALVSLAAANVFVAFVPPVLWLSAPFHVGIK